jgi:hypothetical protein
VERLCCVMTSKPSQDAHGDLYSAIVAWYVRTFYDDLSDIDWLRACANRDEVEQGRHEP